MPEGRAPEEGEEDSEAQGGQEEKVEAIVATFSFQLAYINERNKTDAFQIT